MTLLDWGVLVASLVGIVLYGLWRGRENRDLGGYLLADRTMRWPTIALSIMATQASAITFLSTPGQGFADGMRFVQFYFGLPIAMIVLAATAVPIYHRLKVFTAYEYLEKRFDVKTRTLAATLFLVQRGLAAGLTIYAPSLILSVLLGWNLAVTNLVTGALVIVYTASGGSKAVNHTQFLQMMIIFLGFGVALVYILGSLPGGISLGDAIVVAGKMGKLNAVDYSFDLRNRYNFWSGLIGGFFVALSYFGTDQSQVGRYLTGRSIAESRTGLLANGIVKIPMQFAILFLGAMVFVFYLFSAPPVFFNPVEVERVRAGSHGAEFRGIEERYAAASEARRTRAVAFVEARRAGDPAAAAAAEEALREADAGAGAARREAIEVIEKSDPAAQTSDTNYVFLSFVLRHLPAGIVGLVLAAIFAASMSSTSAELNSLSSTTSVDFYKRFVERTPDDADRATARRDVLVSKGATVVWGAFAIAFAEYASRLGSLIEAVNILGSLVYGTILGIFVVGFYLKRVGGTAVFAAAIVSEAAVIACFLFTDISFLWYNVVGCLGVILLASLLAAGGLGAKKPAPATA
ncbi:MAG TPA: sodium:solute symporter [Candidatus Eisenbacteria bacterium]|nr:sodium:solute symporter [Candidatus Eisenbacteria bacterium]